MWSALAGLGAGVLTSSLFEVAAVTTRASEGDPSAWLRLMLDFAPVVMSAAFTAVALRTGGWKALVLVAAALVLVAAAPKLDALLVQWRCGALGQLGCFPRAGQGLELWQALIGGVLGVGASQLLPVRDTGANAFLEAIGALGALAALIPARDLWLTASAEHEVVAALMQAALAVAAGMVAALVVSQRARRPAPISLAVAGLLSIFWWIGEGDAFLVAWRGPLVGVLAVFALALPAVPLALWPMLHRVRRTLG